MTLPVFAYNYTFESGDDYGDVLGKPTSTDVIVITDPMTENTRRNKDAAYNPPPYGVGSGDIPTDYSSLYHNNSPSYSGGTGSTSVGVTYSDNNTGGGSVSPITGTDYGGMLPPTSMDSPDILNMSPLYYKDGSIGTLSIPQLKLTVKVFEGETLDNMRVGVGHFEFTSSWDGNVSIAGHNRGVPTAIGGIKDLKNGDKITYTTKYGVRTYEVYNKQKIADTDYSVLGWSDTNILTLITCVEGVPNLRWCVQFREIKV
jgi:sortase A